MSLFPSPHHAISKTAITMALLTSLLPAAAHAQITFKDHRGVEINLESPPEKLVTIVRSGPILYRAVDGTADHISAVNKSFFTRDYLSGRYGEILPELGNLAATAAREGFVPNVEALLEINPDVIIQWATEPQNIEPLERVGLTVVGWNCCTEADRRDYLTISGKLSGKTQQAEKILAAQDASNAVLRERFSTFDSADTVSLLQVDQLNDQIRVIANASLDFSLSGVNTPAADDSNVWWKTVDLEQLYVWNPQMILIPPYARDLTPETFYSNPLLASLDAVENRRVYKIPAFAGSPDGPEIYLVSSWIAALAHGADAAPDFRANVRQVYKTIYDIELADAQIDRILSMEENAGSQAYGSLFE